MRSGRTRWSLRRRTSGSMVTASPVAAGADGEDCGAMGRMPATVASRASVDNRSRAGRFAQARTTEGRCAVPITTAFYEGDERRQRRGRPAHNEAPQSPPVHYSPAVLGAAGQITTAGSGEMEVNPLPRDRQSKNRAATVI